jgi:hypothetical protein
MTPRVQAIEAPRARRRYPWCSPRGALRAPRTAVALPELLYWSRIDCFDRAAVNRALAEYPTMGAQL